MRAPGTVSVFTGVLVAQVVSSWRRVAFAGALIVCAASAASPHAFLAKASPAARATLPDSPGRIELSFNERLEPAYSTASVWNAAGMQVDSRDAGLDARDPKRLTVGLPPLPAGEYTVRYRVLSVDGHVVEASYRFSVRERASGAPSGSRPGGASARSPVTR